MAKKHNTSTRPRKVEKYGRHEFELSVSANARKVSDIVALYNRGALKGDEYCFLWDNMQNIAKEVAYGWYNNAALKENPMGRHALEDRSLKVRKSITEAFTSIPDEKTTPEEDS